VPLSPPAPGATPLKVPRAVVRAIEKKFPTEAGNHYQGASTTPLFPSMGCDPEERGELPDSDASHTEAGFPIHRELPLGLRNPIGLTFPPRAGVLVPKTHTSSCNLLPISLVLADGSEGQDGSSIPP
jgi:hypothetical protein